MEETKNAAQLVSSALLGYDCKVVIIANRRYVIYPPTIAKIAGAALFLSNISEADSVSDMLAKVDMKDACKALSWLIDGSEKLAEDLTGGTLSEVVQAISEAYSLIDLTDFIKLSTLARNVGKMIANQKQ